MQTHLRPFSRFQQVARRCRYLTFAMVHIIASASMTPIAASVSVVVHEGMIENPVQQVSPVNVSSGQACVCCLPPMLFLPVLLFSSFFCALFCFLRFPLEERFSPSLALLSRWNHLSICGQLQVLDHVGESSLYRWPLQCESLNSGTEKEEKLLQVRVTRQLVAHVAGISHAQEENKKDVSSPRGHPVDPQRLVRIS